MTKIKIIYSSVLPHKRNTFIVFFILKRLCNIKHTFMLNCLLNIRSVLRTLKWLILVLRNQSWRLEKYESYTFAVHASCGLLLRCRASCFLDGRFQHIKRNFGACFHNSTKVITIFQVDILGRVFLHTLRM